MQKQTLTVWTVALALAASAWVPAAAQSSPLVPGGIVAGAGTGYGATTLSCAGCASRRESSFAFSLRAGVAVTHSLVIALEGTGWSKDFGNSTSNATARAGFADLVAQWYPVHAVGFFLKGGGGAARIREDITSTGIPRTRIESSTSDLVGGLGWDIPMARHISLTPYADFHHAPKRATKVNNTSSTEQLGASLVHVGIAATWR